MRFHGLKTRAATIADRIGVNRLFREAQRAVGGPSIRVVNYHGTAPEYAEAFESHLAYFAKHFRPASPRDIRACAAGAWRHQQPGLVLTFDDGIANNVEVAAPLLEKYGFSGWFFVPVSFVDVATDAQHQFIQTQQIALSDAERSTSSEERVAMTWDQVRSLTPNHVVGCHSYGHVRLRDDLDHEALRREIIDSKERLGSEIGQTVEAFSWVGGQSPDYSASAARTIAEAGYRYSFMTNSAPVRRGTDLLQLQRTHLESHWDLPLVRFQLSGIVDAAYVRKRRRVNRLTQQPGD